MNYIEQIDKDILQTAPSYHLQAVIKARQIPMGMKLQNIGPATNSAAMAALSQSVAELAEYLFAPDAIVAALGELGTLERLMLHELVACGGRANSRDLALYCTIGGFLVVEAADGAGAVPNIEPAAFPARSSGAYVHGSALQYPVAHPHGSFEQALRHLLLLGLLFWGKQTNFAGRDYTSGIHDGVLIVPQAVRTVVRKVWPVQDSLLVTLLRLGENDNESRDEVANDGSDDHEPLQEAQDAKELAGLEIPDGVRGLQRMLYLYWSMVDAMREGLTLVSNGLLSRASLRYVVEHMVSKGQGDQIRSESDDPYLLFLRLMLLKLGLLIERRGTLHACNAETFFALPVIERARRCYQLYMEGSFWNELLYLPEVNIRPGPVPMDPAHDEVIRARATVMERVLHETVAVWRDFPTFIARTKLYAPNLLFPRQYGSRAERYSSNSNPYGWDFRLRRGWLTHREGWHMVEGSFARAVVSGPLYWLGMVELDNQEKPGAFRLEKGVLLIMDATLASPQEEDWGRLIVQPNFELIALAPVSELLLVTLDRFAERVSLEHIAQYRLTKASVTRALQKGIHADEIQQALQRAVAGGEIPQNVYYSLSEWERQARRVEIWQEMTLLEVDDAALLDTLFANEEVRILFGRRLSSVLAEVASQQLSTVQALLWQRDYLPALSAATGESANVQTEISEPQWLLHDDGLLEPRYRVVDLYLASETEVFCEIDEVSGWQRITSASLQRALQRGMTLEQIIAFLQGYCYDGIPGALLIRLKLWGGGYHHGQVITVEHAPLLRLSAQVLHDLKQDRAVNPLLGDEVEQEARLVRVREEDLPHILELLRERGFTME
jgi:Helicase conserved C-terminal domain